MSTTLPTYKGMDYARKHLISCQKHWNDILHLTPKKDNAFYPGNFFCVLTKKISKSEMMAGFYLVAPSLFRFMIFTWLSFFCGWGAIFLQNVLCDVADRTLSGSFKIPMVYIYI